MRRLSAVIAIWRRSIEGNCNMTNEMRRIILNHAKLLWPTIDSLRGEPAADPMHTQYDIREFGKGFAIYVSTPYASAAMLAVDHEHAGETMLGMVLLLASRRCVHDSTVSD
jgi:hypothetical protein